MATSPDIAEFLDLMPSTVSVEPFLADDRFGKPSYGPVKTYPAHLSNKSCLVRGANGETVVAKGSIWIGTGDPIDDKARITLPNKTAPVSILAVNGGDDETGLTLYTRVDFG